MLTLPAHHLEGELDLARSIAQEIGSAELYVFWTAARPVQRVPHAVTARASVLVVFEALMEALGELFAPRRAQQPA